MLIVLTLVCAIFSLIQVKLKADLVSNREDLVDKFRRHYLDNRNKQPNYHWRRSEDKFNRRPYEEGPWRSNGAFRNVEEVRDENEIDVLTGAAVDPKDFHHLPIETFNVESRVEHRQVVAAPLQQIQGKQLSKTSQPSIDTSSGVYFIALVAGCSAATVCGVIAAGFCWYKFQKNAKSAAEAEYPAYGVTGPNKDHVSPSSGGDRKLAHSAQMYHYQHQKQQMIAMEKNNGERQVSTSDLDSEDENEEGDYTVYECPGLAPTGEMEVKNPLFQDDPNGPSSPPVLTKPNDGSRQESTGF